MTWTNIPNAAITTNKPIKATTGRALRDNVPAAFNGDTGAPRLSDSALGSTATTDGRDWVIDRLALGDNASGDGKDWVLDRTSELTAGSVGSYAFAELGSGTPNIVAFGETVAGSRLTPANLNGGTGSSLSGTWRCLGYSRSDGATDAAISLFLRIA